MDTSEIRRRLVRRLEELKRDGVRRREAVDRAQAEFPAFLKRVALPVFTTFAQALRAEGFHYRLDTPTGAVRLTQERSPESFLEVVLDATLDPPGVVGRISHVRGRRTLTRERPLREGAEVSHVTDEDVVQFLLDELAPFVER